MAVIVSGVFVSGYRILIMLGRLFVGSKGSVALSLYLVWRLLVLAFVYLSVDGTLYPLSNRLHWELGVVLDRKLIPATTYVVGRIRCA